MGRLEFMRKNKIRNYSGRNFKRERQGDKLSKRRRSLLMSKIGSKNTNFEKTFVSFIRKGIHQKFITHVKEIRGTPDVVFKKQKLCIFLDSDFWHGWQYPRWKHLLKNDFWKTKIENNRTRDRRNTAYLGKNGWKVLRIWGHQIDRQFDEMIKKVIENL